jgi:hypothetical protein
MPIANPIAPRISAVRSRLTSSHTSEIAPAKGNSRDDPSLLRQTQGRGRAGRRRFEWDGFAGRNCKRDAYTLWHAHR